MARILGLDGPNLNLLGIREPKHYGNTSLETLHDKLVAAAQKLGHHMTCHQCNGEPELIEHIHSTRQLNIDFIIINPAAYTHTSVALRDALLAVAVPFIEVHLSNVHSRESFRQHSYFSDIAKGVITGLGVYGYELALLAADNYLNQIAKNN